MKILIVDDNADERRMLRYLLAAHGHDVLEAGNGREGLNAASAHSPELIISDVLMPVMDGFQFLRNLRETSEAPFIFYSAVYDGSKDKQLAFSLGADGYIVKPADPPELMKEIERITGKGPKDRSDGMEDTEYLKRYSQVVVSKLEEKVLELEASLAERKLAGDALAAREREFRTLAENSPDHIMRFDVKRRVSYINPQLEKSLGVNAVDIVGNTLSIPGDCFENYRQTLDRVFTTGEKAQIEVEMPDLGEGRKFHLVSMVAERDQHGGIAGVLSIGRDITERRAAEQALLDEQKRLADMALELSMAEERERRRIATALHDNIGQDLTLARIKLGMLSRAALTEVEADDLGNAREIIDRMIRSVCHLTHLICPPILESAGLGAALKWLGRQMETDYGLQVEFTCGLEEKEIIREIHHELFYAVRELLINVAKHAKTRSARLLTGCEDGVVVIRVEDDGIGFDPAVSAYNQGCDKGGFGLFNVRRRINHIGGTCAIDSAPEAGTRVIIRVPLINGPNNGAASN